MALCTDHFREVVTRRVFEAAAPAHRVRNRHRHPTCAAASPSVRGGDQSTSTVTGHTERTQRSAACASDPPLSCTTTRTPTCIDDSSRTSRIWNGRGSSSGSCSPATAVQAVTATLQRRHDSPRLKRRHRAVAVQRTLDEAEGHRCDEFPLGGKRQRTHRRQPHRRVLRVRGGVTVLIAPVALRRIQQRQVQPPRRGEVLQQRVGIARSDPVIELEPLEHPGRAATAGVRRFAETTHAAQDSDLKDAQTTALPHIATLSIRPPAAIDAQTGFGPTKTSSGPYDVAGRQVRPPSRWSAVMQHRSRCWHADSLSGRRQGCQRRMLARLLQSLLQRLYPGKNIVDILVKTRRDEGAAVIPRTFGGFPLRESPGPIEQTQPLSHGLPTALLSVRHVAVTWSTSAA